MPRSRPVASSPVASRLQAQRPKGQCSKTQCDACSAPIEGEPAARGLLLFPRGDRVLREEPPLCESCAHAIGITALFRFAEEEEEG